VSIFGRNKGPSLTVPQRFVHDVNAVVATFTAEEQDNFGDRIFEYMPILIRQACRPTTAGEERLFDTIKTAGKKLIFRGVLDPVQCFRDIMAALDEFAPDIQRIVAEQAKRYREQKERERRGRIEGAAAPRQFIDAIVVQQKALEPVK
jgi:hypothetical protein